MIYSAKRTLLGMLLVGTLCGQGCSGGGASGPEGAQNAPGAIPPPPPVMAGPEPVARPAVGVQAAAKSPKSQGEPGTGSVGGMSVTANEFIVMTGPDDIDLHPPGLVSLRDEFEIYVPAPGTTYSNASVVWPAESEPARRVEAGSSADPRLPQGFSVVIAPEQNSEELPPRIRCELDGSEMVLVPAGLFQQGTNGGPSECGPEHPAFVSSFYIDVTEVTLAQFARFQSHQKEQKKATLPAPANADDEPQMPVLGISWKDAELYAKHIGKELPTESEWEKAARGTQGVEFPWGNSRPAWNAPRLPGQIDPVGMFNSDRSPYGVFDMAGNAREWVADWYAPATYQSAREKDGSPIRDSKGAPRAEVVGYKVVKGAERSWEVWHSDKALTRDGHPDIGFRCVLRVSEKSSADQTTTTPTKPITPPAATPAGTVKPPAAGF